MPLGGSTRSIPDRDLLMIYVVRYTVHATVPDHAPGEHPTLSAVYGCLRARFIAEAMCVVSSRFSPQKQVYRLVYISILVTQHTRPIVTGDWIDDYILVQERDAANTADGSHPRMYVA